MAITSVYFQMALGSNPVRDQQAKIEKSNHCFNYFLNCKCVKKQD